MMRLRLFFSIATLCVALTACSGETRACDRSRNADSPACKLENNKAMARRVYEEGLNQGRFEVPYTKDFVGRGGTTTFTHEDGMAEARGFRSAFPDLKVAIDLIVAEGDLVSVRWTARGTNTGTGNGIPATGKAVRVSGITIFRFADGAIAEEWTSGDTLGLMRQLGLLPSASAGAAQQQGTS